MDGDDPGAGADGDAAGIEEGREGVMERRVPRLEGGRVDMIKLGRMETTVDCWRRRGRKRVKRMEVE